MSVVRPLSDVEARVLFVLVEKEHTVPDTYPLTLNALVAGCNQKTSRDPVMNLTDSGVQEAIDSLRRLSLIIESSGGRAMRYAHNVGRVLGVPSQSVALLTVLALRGPQTVGELRINSERLHRFLDLSSVEGFLDELAAREAGALVRQLPRQAGTREVRWTHLLCGEPALPAGFVPADGGAAGDVSWQADRAASRSGDPAERRIGAASDRPSSALVDEQARELIQQLSGQVTALNDRVQALEQEVEFLKLQFSEWQARG